MTTYTYCIFLFSNFFDKKKQTLTVENALINAIIWLTI